MEIDTAQEQGPDSDPYFQTQSILMAASKHDLETLRTLLRTGSASAQDPETKITPLHAAIAVCEDSLSDNSPFTKRVKNIEIPEAQRVGSKDSENLSKSVDSERSKRSAATLEAATKTVKVLLQNGAIWNDIDADNETPGCLARRLGLTELYEIMVDAGVRAEMLLNRLDEYQMLRDDDHDEYQEDLNDEQIPKDEKLIRDNQNDNMKAEQDLKIPGLLNETADPSNTAYLESRLVFQDDRILDSAQNGVMMTWETDIMRQTATRLAPNPSLRILNIGYGMGIIDDFFQQSNPSTHHIIEAHPAILTQMHDAGWNTKSNVTVHHGRWQDIVPQLINQGILFDAIYFDTFAEDYKTLRSFFSDSVIGLLEDGGRWGFFNGLGADRQICYDVYGKIVEMDLFEAGFDTEWVKLEVGKMANTEWDGVRRRYWALEEYKLPVCRFMG